MKDDRFVINYHHQRWWFEIGHLEGATLPVLFYKLHFSIRLLISCSHQHSLLYLLQYLMASASDATSPDFMQASFPPDSYLHVPTSLLPSRFHSLAAPFGNMTLLAKLAGRTFWY